MVVWSIFGSLSFFPFFFLFFFLSSVRSLIKKRWVERPIYSSGLILTDLVRIFYLFSFVFLLISWDFLIILPTISKESLNLELNLSFFLNLNTSLIDATFKRTCQSQQTRGLSCKSLHNINDVPNNCEILPSFKNLRWNS